MKHPKKWGCVRAHHIRELANDLTLGAGLARAERRLASRGRASQRRENYKFVS